MKRYILFPIVLLTLIACDPKAQEQSSDANTSNTSGVEIQDGQIATDMQKPVGKYFSNGKAELTYGVPEGGKTVDEEGTVIHRASVTARLTSGFWHCMGKSLEPEFPKGNPACVGMWWKFSEDGTFQKGRYSEVDRTGKWGFDEQERVIEFIYDDEPARLFGYYVQFGTESMLFRGHSTYSTNPTMMKVERYDERPLTAEELQQQASPPGQ